MKVSIHLPKGMTAGELASVVREALREAERIRRARDERARDRDLTEGGR